MPRPHVAPKDFFLLNFAVIQVMRTTAFIFQQQQCNQESVCIKPSTFVHIIHIHISVADVISLGNYFSDVVARCMYSILLSFAVEVILKGKNVFFLNIVVLCSRVCIL